MSRSDLEPISARAGTAQLLACLTLVAPTGMTAEDRHAWVAVAKETLTGIPADLLERGCAKARVTCRFASEIVPCIHEEISREWTRRKKRAAEDRAAWENRIAPRLEHHEPQFVSREETQRIIREAFASNGGDAA